MGQQTVSADEPAGRGPGHRLTALLLAPWGQQQEQPQHNNLPEFQRRSKVRKVLDTTTNDDFCRAKKVALRISVAPCAVQETVRNSNHHDRSTPASGGSFRSKYMRYGNSRPT
jgi:hypothetical protein